MSAAMHRLGPMDSLSLSLSYGACRGYNTGLNGFGSFLMPSLFLLFRWLKFNDFFIL